MTTVNGHAEEKMREAGLRVTPQRRAVWQAFGEGGGGHLAADEVFARARRGLPELSRATVYNTLAAFVEVGMLQAVESRGAVLYDPNPDPDHHHFRCRRCDRLYDVPVEGVGGSASPARRGSSSNARPCSCAASAPRAPRRAKDRPPAARAFRPSRNEARPAETTNENGGS